MNGSEMPQRLCTFSSVHQVGYRSAMPELGEVAHAASLLRRFLLGRTISKATTFVDDIVYVGPLTNTVFEENVVGTKVTEVGRQGKYFWFECDGARTIVLHFGMTGWIHVRNIRTHFIAMEGGGDRKQKERMEQMEKDGQSAAQIVVEECETETWPPKFTKFILTTDDSREIAFTDARRLGRIRLIAEPATAALGLEPLSKLGTDFSQTELDLETVGGLIRKRKVPVKALLLDQTVFSGIGNWMADEILYQARIHPEQYANTLSAEQLDQLYTKLLSVCKVSVEMEGNSAAFPKDWLMLHRWGKGRKKVEQKTPDGYKVAHLTVGGRTSCYVPELQRMLTVEQGAEVPPGSTSNAPKRGKKPAKAPQVVGEVEVKEEVVTNEERGDALKTRTTTSSRTRAKITKTKELDTGELDVKEEVEAPLAETVPNGLQDAAETVPAKKRRIRKTRS